MYLTTKEELAKNEVENSRLVIHVLPDNKTFHVIKNNGFPESVDEIYPMSMLKHILLSSFE
jgi:hypothetical protein